MWGIGWLRPLGPAGLVRCVDFWKGWLHKVENWNDIGALNERAQKLGLEVVAEELVGDSQTLARGSWVCVKRDGERIFKSSWRTEEVDTWLRFREREARDASAQNAVAG